MSEKNGELGFACWKGLAALECPRFCTNTVMAIVYALPTTHRLLQARAESLLGSQLAIDLLQQRDGLAGQQTLLAVADAQLVLVCGHVAACGSVLRKNKLKLVRS